MLEQVKYYANYVKAVISYSTECINLVVGAINNWPKWIPPVKEIQNKSVLPNIADKIQKPSKTNHSAIEG